MEINNKICGKVIMVKVICWVLYFSEWNLHYLCFLNGRMGIIDFVIVSVLVLVERRGIEWIVGAQIVNVYNDIYGGNVRLVTYSRALR